MGRRSEWRCAYRWTPISGSAPWEMAPPMAAPLWHPPANHIKLGEISRCQEHVVAECSAHSNGRFLRRPRFRLSSRDSCITSTTAAAALARTCSRNTRDRSVDSTAHAHEMTRADRAGSGSQATDVTIVS